MIFQNVKSPFQARTKSSTSRKIDIFPEGLILGFGLKMAIFSTFFFQAIQKRKMSFTIFQNVKTPFQPIQTKSSTSGKIEMFTKWLTDSFGQKMAIFQNFFFQAIQASKMSFTIIQNEKNALEGKIANVGYKKKKFKKSKNLHFSKGVNPWFWSKNSNFSNSFFQAIQARKILTMG